MEKKLYFYVITYQWEGCEELSYYYSTLIYNDKKELIKQASANLYGYTNDPCVEVVGFKIIIYDLNAGTLL